MQFEGWLEFRGDPSGKFWFVVDDQYLEKYKSKKKDQLVDVIGLEDSVFEHQSSDALSFSITDTSQAQWKLKALSLRDFQKFVQAVRAYVKMKQSGPGAIEYPVRPALKDRSNDEVRSHHEVKRKEQQSLDPFVRRPDFVQEPEDPVEPPTVPSQSTQKSKFEGWLHVKKSSSGSHRSWVVVENGLLKVYLDNSKLLSPDSMALEGATVKISKKKLEWTIDGVLTPITANFQRKWELKADNTSVRDKFLEAVLGLVKIITPKDCKGLHPAVIGENYLI